MKLGKLLTSICLGVLLASCNSNTQLAEGGITGSGISFGPITAFGSIWVGGVRYDTSNAEFVRNGQTIANDQSSFRVGEIVNIVGDVNADGVSGVASKVEFDRNLAGVITAIDADNNSLHILNQPVETDILSLFSGFSTLADLAPGHIVEISGSRTPGGTWIASTVTLLQQNFVSGESELEVEGRIASVHAESQTFKVGDLTVNYAQAILNGITDLTQANGQYIEIKSDQNLVNNQLLATMITLEDEFPQFAVNRSVTLDGRITDFSNSQVFTVNGQAIATTNATRLINGDNTDIGLNAHLSVEGLINQNGILEADAITIRQSTDPSKTITIEAAIEAINTQARTLTILGTTVIIDNSTLLLDFNLTEGQTITFEDLVVNNLVRISGRKIGENTISVLRIDRNPPTTKLPDTDAGTTQQGITITGTTSKADKQNLTFAIGDTHIVTGSDTLFSAPEQEAKTLTAEAFLDIIINNDITIQVTGYSLGNGWVKATSLNIIKGDT